MAFLRSMKRLLLLLLICPSAAMAQVTPNFTTGTMTQTTTATQTITETSSVERYGGAVQVWNGDNVQPITATDIVTSGDFEVVDTALPWQLEITTRAAGIVETVDTTRTIQTDTVTNTLSVFSQ
jgi:hypothetical protein